MSDDVDCILHNLFKNFIHIIMLTSVSIQKPCVAQTAALRAAPVARRVSARMTVRAGAAAAEDVPSPEKRGIMNLLLLGAVGAPVRGHWMILATRWPC